MIKIICICVMQIIVYSVSLNNIITCVCGTQQSERRVITVKVKIWHSGRFFPATVLFTGKSDQI